MEDVVAVLLLFSFLIYITVEGILGSTTPMATGLTVHFDFEQPD